MYSVGVNPPEPKYAAVFSKADRYLPWGAFAAIQTREHERKLGWHGRTSRLYEAQSLLESLAKVEMVQFVHHFRESALMCVLFFYGLLRCRF